MTCVSRVQNALQQIAGVSQVAIETAGITLMRQDLNTVADALAISQAALRNMKHNLPGHLSTTPAVFRLRPADSIR